MNARILIVDDEARMAEAVAMALTRSGYECVTCTNGQQALEHLSKSSFDVVISDKKMPGLSGIELLREIRAKYLSLPVIIMTAYSDVPSAVAAMREGAFDYVTKPFDNDELRALVSRALELSSLRVENQTLRKAVGEKYAPDSIVAESKKSKDVLELVRRVAPAKAAVLIQGDSGTGKELIARLLHYWSDRLARPFIAVNCKAFAEGVLESELFGHEKGAFTGADRVRPGCFERADGGTLFLDEIGEVSVDFQAKLLRAIQEGEVLRVGGETPKKVDVRIVAATNKNLRVEIARAAFREDLFFRLNVIPLSLSPLRERSEDILPLARAFLARHRERANLSFSPESEIALAAHPWPGNVRELENAIERAVVLARGEVITPEDLLLEPVRTAGTAANVAEGTLQDAIDRASEQRIAAALESTGGRRAEAAEILGVERTTLYRLMKRFGIA
jgi:DNA-binding NtrC family response regulator